MLVLNLLLFIALVSSAYSRRLEELVEGSNDLAIDGHSPENQKRNKVQFSGLYAPSRFVGSELYAGAWLAPKQRLLNDARHIQTIVNLEGASFHVVLNDVSLMTRDFLDFEIIHLSSTTNNFPELENSAHQRELIKKMTKTVESLLTNFTVTADHQSPTFRYKDKRILQNTVAIIPYSNVPASQYVDPKRKELSDFTTSIRTLFLEATVWSVYRVFPRVIVACGSASELESVRKLSLPIWKYVDLSEGLKNRHLLPKQALLYVLGKLNGSSISSLEEDREWESVKYVYYTEADEMLTSRFLPLIYNVIDRTNGEIAVVPHRMQSIAHPLAFPYHRDNWKRNWGLSKYNTLMKVDLVTEDPLIPIGSCCDNGRFQFKECGHWWYNCPKYGLHNYTQWVRFGEHGFTLPFATEHQARCTYSNPKVVCPLPQNCDKKSPRSKNEACIEMPIKISVP